MLGRRGGRISGTLIGGRTEWRQDIGVLLGRTVIVLLPSTVWICLLLNQACISIVSNCYIGLRFLPSFYVTNLLANV